MLVLIGQVLLCKCICTSKYGVPQGSVLEPQFFTMCMLPLRDIIISKHDVSFHCYADDTPLYISSHHDETYQFAKLTNCIVDISIYII